MPTTDPKEHAHELIERLPPTQVAAVARLLEAMLDPVSLSIANAPADEETLTAEEKKALDEAQDWLKHNKGIPHERVLTELVCHPGKRSITSRNRREAHRVDRAGPGRHPAAG